LFKIAVGIGSKSQVVSGNGDRSLETSSGVIQVKDEKLGGVNGEGKWGEAEVRLISRLVRSLWILSEKNLANDWDKRLTESWAGRAGKEGRWRSILIIFQSWWGLVELDELREKL